MYVCMMYVYTCRPSIPAASRRHCYPVCVCDDADENDDNDGDNAVAAAYSGRRQEPNPFEVKKKPFPWRHRGQKGYPVDRKPVKPPP